MKGFFFFTAAVKLELVYVHINNGEQPGKTKLA